MREDPMKSRKAIPLAVVWFSHSARSRPAQTPRPPVELDMGPKNTLLKLMSTLVMVMGLIPGSPAVLTAQTTEAAVPPGSRIRVTASSAPYAPQLGVLQAWQPETLVLDRPGLEPLTVPLPDVVKLEISRGKKGHWLTGTLFGTAVGIGTGLIIANASSVTDESPNDPLTGFAAAMAEEGMDIATVLVSTVAGAGLGALVGSLIKTESWEEIPMPAGSAPRDPAIVRR
jgi:hypothetical protein